MPTQGSGQEREGEQLYISAKSYNQSATKYFSSDPFSGMGSDAKPGPSVQGVEIDPHNDVRLVSFIIRLSLTFILWGMDEAKATPC